MNQRIVCLWKTVSLVIEEKSVGSSNKSNMQKLKSKVPSHVVYCVVSMYIYFQRPVKNKYIEAVYFLRNVSVDEIGWHLSE